MRWVFYLLACMWVTYALDWILPLDLRNHGILPRDFKGLLGILTSPFLHGDLFHLAGNSVPFLVLGGLLSVFYRTIAFKVFVQVAFLGGMILWVIGRSGTVHIGASMAINGLICFLVYFGFKNKQAIPIGVSILVLALYGLPLLIGLLPIHRYISWEGHLAGAIAGLMVARITKAIERH